MKILNAEQIRDWDQYTIQHESISSVDLMERAAGKCVEWLDENGYLEKQFSIFCGAGNNGGDGLAIARILAESKSMVVVYILGSDNKGSDDFETNLLRLQLTDLNIHFIQKEKDFPVINSNTIIIDALFGSGLSRSLEGIIAKQVQHINKSRCEVISIDIPSGMYVDRSSKGKPMIKARHTLSFQCYKPAFLMAENAEYFGEVHILDIGLKPEYLSSISVAWELVDEEIIHSIYKPRDPFAHKGKYGHALLVAGGYGKMGAAVLASRACIRSGVGLLTCFIPKSGYDIMQKTVPEAMVMTDLNSSFISKIELDLSKYNVIGIGPGIGTASETRAALKELFFQNKKPIVIDADGLNCVAMEKDILNSLSPQSILTPHPREFERLFGETANEFDRIQLAIKKANELNVIIVLKGHHSLIATPEGKGFFNSTGNPGMAKGGSGDVLTGIITALLAQGYGSSDAAILGVHLHGLAGDLAEKKLSQEAMVAGDIIENLSNAFLSLK